MSFILDALRRADRERESERGGVPSLYTQAVPPPVGNPQADDEAPRPWLWLAAGLGGGLVVAAVWALWSATPAALPTATETTAPTNPAPTTEATPAPPPAVAATPTPAPATMPSPAPAATVRRPETQATDAGREAARAEPRRSPLAEAGDGTRPAPPRTPEPAARAQTQPAPPPAATAPPAREREAVARIETPRESPATSSRAGDDTALAPPLRQMGELSAEQRGRLPTLTFGGAMYSAKAANRRLIVNGQLLSEGEAVAPGVTLEEIRLKSAVLRTRDLRVEMGF
jgi:general secretion pathway protein B